ncbi:DsbC family protein [Ideonella livida]|uniref:Thiol:disulfide interchange protein n=1 Tax=Ideonella livida TaxID=2707176 RepID=A0A7C9PI45_9BURK|nr:DsbC family protein [Ideonella livida]NDY92573.1 DsbC family protein [Ideonella livida]
MRRLSPALALRAPLAVAGLCLAVLATAAHANEEAIRKALTERMPGLPKIDEISKSPIPGLYEVRMGADILYVDETGDHVIEGSIYNTRTRTDLTKARIDKLTAVAFADLPLKDAIVIKQGNGSRRLAVFVDPNCGYCKRLEKDLQALKDVTIYNFVIPILGPDSQAKAKDIWCAKDAGRVWRNWMVEGTVPPRVMDKCDIAAIDRNLEFSRKYRINGTPALIFEDGTRTPGAIPADRIEKQLQAARRPA